MLDNLLYPVVPDSAAPLVIGLCAVVAAAIGSFLNVVIYRVPRRLSLVKPPSQCPQCGHPIRWRDNLPVVGWLLLGGRCRDCRTPISPRYPAVEAFLAAIGGLLGWKALLPLGSTTSLYLVDPIWIAFQLLPLSTLICAAAIEFDGFVPPARLLQVPATIGAILLIISKTLLSPGDLMPFSGLPAGLSGAAIGWLLGLAPGFTMVSNTEGARGRYVLLAMGELMLVGFFVGDHAIVPIALETMALFVASQLLARAWPAAGRFGWAGPLFVATLAWLITAPDAPFDPVLSDELLLRFALAVAIMTALAVVLQLAPPPKRYLQRSAKAA
jgi:prepilin signal peptidase PulO-like enzyme (type II secretory pathway)